jgi:hypothetical protein
MQNTIVKKLASHVLKIIQNNVLRIRCYPISAPFFQIIRPQNVKTSTTKKETPWQAQPKPATQKT